jgi:hypothetical protein
VNVSLPTESDYLHPDLFLVIAHVSNTRPPQSLIAPAPILMLAALTGVERFGEALPLVGDALG